MIEYSDRNPYIPIGTQAQLKKEEEDLKKGYERIKKEKEKNKKIRHNAYFRRVIQKRLDKLTKRKVFDPQFINQNYRIYNNNIKNIP